MKQGTTTNYEQHSQKMTGTATPSDELPRRYHVHDINSSRGNASHRPVRKEKIFNTQM